MMECSAHFQVTIGRNGSARVRFFPDDGPPEVILDRNDLAKEIQGLLETAFESGRSVGKSDVRAAIRNQLGIE